MLAVAVAVAVPVAVAGSDGQGGKTLVGKAPLHGTGRFHTRPGRVCRKLEHLLKNSHCKNSLFTHTALLKSIS